MPATYALRFMRIDNQAKIVINQADVWASPVIHHDPPNLDIPPVPLDGFLQPGKNLVQVQCLNVDGLGQNPWHIQYEIIMKGHSAGIVDRSGPHIKMKDYGVKIIIEHRFVWPFRDDLEDKPSELISNLVGDISE